MKNNSESGKATFEEWIDLIAKSNRESQADSMMVMELHDKDGTIITRNYNVNNYVMSLFRQEIRHAEIRQFIKDNPDEIRKVLEELKE